MDVKDAVYKRRSVRSFSGAGVDMELLVELVDAARVGPSAANTQPLEYVAVSDPALCEEVFGCLKWAAYIAPKGTPAEGKRPGGYVVVTIRKEYAHAVGTDYDLGAAVQTIMLLAVSRGLGTCWLKAINKPKLAKILGMPEGFEIDSVVALGPADEDPERVDLKPDQTGLEVIKYWRDESEKHFVPKRALEAVLHRQKF